MVLPAVPSQSPIWPSVLKKKVTSAPSRMSTIDECVTRYPIRGLPQGKSVTIDATRFTTNSAWSPRNQGAK